MNTDLIDKLALPSVALLRHGMFFRRRLADRHGRFLSAISGRLIQIYSALRRVPGVLHRRRLIGSESALRFTQKHAKLDSDQRFVTDERNGSSTLATEVPHHLFDRWRTGDTEAMNELLPLIYEELRQVARKHLRGQRIDHTLQTTALIHEAYLRLAGGARVNVQGHVHFVALASRIMRQVLVDHARARLATKRHGGLRVTLSEAINVAVESELDVIAMDEALTRLAELDEQQAHVVELRYFGGLSIEDTALALSISAATVKRDWTMARTWLRSELRSTPA